MPTLATATPSKDLDGVPMNWDGKCGKCRRLMSRCTCFQDPEEDGSASSAWSSSKTSDDDSETRPLWNALRKMHHKSPVSRLALVRPPRTVSIEDDHRKPRHEALPPLSAATSSVSSRARQQHRDRRQTADNSATNRLTKPPKSSRRSSKEPTPEPAPERSSISRQERLQRAGIFASSTSSDTKRQPRVSPTIGPSKPSGASREMGTIIYATPGGPVFNDVENDDAVWEL